MVFTGSAESGCISDSVSFVNSCAFVASLYLVVISASAEALYDSEAGQWRRGADLG